MAIQNPSSCRTLQEEDGTEGEGQGQGSIQFPVSPASSGRRRREPTEAAEQEDAGETAAEVSPQAPSGEHSAGLGGFVSPRSQEEHDLLDVSPYVELVTRVMEGLRGDAFMMAKDLGLSIDGCWPSYRNGIAGGENQGACVPFEVA